MKVNIVVQTAGLNPNTASRQSLGQRRGRQGRGRRAVGPPHPPIPPGAAATEANAAGPAPDTARGLIPARRGGAVRQPGPSPSPFGVTGGVNRLAYFESCPEIRPQAEADTRGTDASAPDGMG